MKTRTLTALAGLSIVASLAGITQTAKADIFSHHTDIWNNDDNTSSASGSGWAQGILPRQMSSGAHIWHNTEDNQVYMRAHMYVSGDFVDPTISGPFIDLMETRGLRTSQSIQLIELEVADEWWQYNTVVSLQFSGYANIWRNDTRTEIEGQMGGSAYGYGIVALDANSTVNIFEADHPTWMPDWEYTMDMTFLVTEDFTVRSIPAPGTIGLAAMGCLAIARRRRH